MNTQAALKQYQDVRVTSGVAAASPHRLVSMLLTGIIENISMARVALANGEIAARGQHIGRAISIIDNLRASLDIESGGELSLNLGSIYDYGETRLLQANIQSSDEMLEEVSGLFRQILEGWEMIPESARGGA